MPLKSDTRNSFSPGPEDQPPQIATSSTNPSMQALITKAMDVENEDATRTYDEAMGKSDSYLWRQAIHDELQSMEQQQVWKLVPRDKVIRTVGCKWVFVVKRNEFHKITR